MPSRQIDVNHGPVMPKIFPFDELKSADLVVDAVYACSSDGQLSGEPISKVLPGSGNMGGFRVSGKGERKNWVVLFSTRENPDWPDNLDLNTGQFLYYGDNRTPGRELHGTTAGGNLVLKNGFERLHAPNNPRAGLCPFFVFDKYPLPNASRSVRFRGLAVPGYPGLSSNEDLVAVWKSTDGQRFQNYRAIFTLLDIPVIKREWLDDLAAGVPDTKNAPPVWQKWIKHGQYTPLTAEPTTIIRSVDEQTPDTVLKKELLRAVWTYFQDKPFEFEAFAAHVYQMTDQRVLIDQVTRATVDGGRDAVGRYLLGRLNDPVYVEFSLEAKCYRPALDGATPNTVGVKEVSRLISRIRHRQFGVLVTTSAVARQAYEEVREDKHPIVFISGRDIAEILIDNGFNSVSAVNNLLNTYKPFGQ